MENDRLQPLVDMLAEGVTKAQSQEGFVAWLDFQAKLHKYSPSNVLLIMMQRPDATMVASYGRWQQLRRQVMRGEKSIKIFAPLIKKERDPDTGEDKKKLFGFKPESVFDIKQTTGEPVPTVEVPELTGNDGKGLYDRLAVVIKEEGYRLIDGSPRVDGVMGYTDPIEKLVMVREDLAQIQRTKTLAHEGIHVLAKHERSDPTTETIAEGGAYIVLKRFGHNSGERSFPYIATWAKNNEVFKANLGYTAQYAKQLIMRVHPEDTSPAVET